MYFLILYVFFSAMYGKDNVDDMISLIKNNIILHDQDNDYSFVDISFDLPEWNTSIIYGVQNKKNGQYFIVKQRNSDYYYEIEKDFLFTILYQVLLSVSKDNKNNEIVFGAVQYIPASTYSSLKKNQDRAALVIPYYKAQKYEKNLQIFVDKKIILDEKIKGLTNELLAHIQDPNNFLLICLDTFFSNPDRNIGNILRMEDKIICIDHGDCYADIALGLEIIKSIRRNIFGNYVWRNSFLRYQNVLREYLNIMPENYIIDCLNYICGLVPPAEQEKRTKLAYMINDIKIHYFFLEYIVNMNYEY